MGIKNLLKLLKAVTVKAKITNFSGKTAAIDASAWLYKGIYSCSWELATKVPTHGYLSYPLKMVDLLLKHSIKPILVFDGLTLPLKENVVSKRKSDKEKNKEVAEGLLAEGKNEKAATMFARCMSIKSYMIYNFMDVLHKMNVEYVVAPYEADAQIAYLCKEKIADFAISEDSDLLVYGCQNLVFKLDLEGNCENIVVNETLRNKEYKKSIPKGPTKDLASLSPDAFMDLCIMSGCDYLENIPGFGLKKALKMLKNCTLEQTIRMLYRNKVYRDKVPEDFLEKINKIKLQFLYGRVIDPRTYTITQINPLPNDVSDEHIDGLGQIFDSTLIEPYAKGIYSMRENEYRERMKDTEIQDMLKEIVLSNMQKMNMENKRKGYVKGLNPNITKGLEAKNTSEAKEINEEEKEMIDLFPKKSTNKTKKKENSQLNRYGRGDVVDKGVCGKRRFYTHFNGDSLVYYFKNHTKRFKEEEVKPNAT